MFDEGLCDSAGDVCFKEIIPASAVTLDFIWFGVRNEEDRPFATAPEVVLQRRRGDGDFGYEGVVVEEGGGDAEDCGVGAVVADEICEGWEGHGKHGFFEDGWRSRGFGV